MLGHIDHTAAFVGGSHADIAASVSASEPPPGVNYAPDGNPDDYEPMPGQGTTDAGFFVQPKKQVVDGGYDWGTRSFRHPAPQDDRPVRGPRKAR
jgi:hypothetical protein